MDPRERAARCSLQARRLFSLVCDIIKTSPDWELGREAKKVRVSE